MPSNNAISRFFALAQVAVGAVAALTVVTAYIVYSGSLTLALEELDGMAERAENEIATIATTLEKTEEVLGAFQRTLPTHATTLASAQRSARDIDVTIATWENELDGFATISTDANVICDHLAEQLPIKVPIVKIAEKTISFDMPVITNKTQTIDLPYPKAKATFGEVALPYPTAKVTNSEFKQGLGEIGNKTVGKLKLPEVKFSYPSNIEIGKKDKSIRYPTNIEITNDSLKIEIPNTPEIKMERFSFKIPDKLELTDRELMKDEKKILEKTAVRLRSTSAAILQTKDSLASIRATIGTDISRSLAETSVNLETASRSIEDLRFKSFQTAISDLKTQHSQLQNARKGFSSLNGLILVGTFIVLSMSLGITFGGIFKLFQTQKG